MPQIRPGPRYHVDGALETPDGRNPVIGCHIQTGPEAGEIIQGLAVAIPIAGNATPLKHNV